jgi:hypothetical protein
VHVDTAKRPLSPPEIAAGRIGRDYCFTFIHSDRLFFSPLLVPVVLSFLILQKSPALHTAPSQKKKKKEETKAPKLPLTLTHPE